ncbi:MAG TPA: ABC transporter ATP-binding protein [Trueperaceae bacterium]
MHETDTDTRATGEPAGDAPALRLEGVTKRFGRTVAVDGLSLEVRRGELYALLGPNGAGKTTTLRIVAGLLRPDAGDARVLGTSVLREPAEAKRRLAFLPDEPLLYGKLNPLEYLEFVAGLWGMPADAALARATELLKWLGLWDNRHDLTETFSRGMKQKLGLAGGLIHEPDVIILDEPLTGLDAADPLGGAAALLCGTAGATATAGVRLWNPVRVSRRDLFRQRRVRGDVVLAFIEGFTPHTWAVTCYLAATLSPWTAVATAVSVGLPLLGFARARGQGLAFGY